MCACVCRWGHAYVQVQEPTCVHTEARDVFLYNLSPYVLRQCLSLNLELSDWPDWVVMSSGTLLSPSLRSRQHWALVFTCLLRVWALWFWQTSNTKHWLIVYNVVDSGDIPPLYPKPISFIYPLIPAQVLRYLSTTNFLYNVASSGVLSNWNCMVGVKQHFQSGLLRLTTHICSCPLVTWQFIPFLLLSNIPFYKCILSRPFNYRKAPWLPFCVIMSEACFRHWCAGICVPFPTNTCSSSCYWPLPQRQDLLFPPSFSLFFLFAFQVEELFGHPHTCWFPCHHVWSTSL